MSETMQRRTVALKIQALTTHTAVLGMTGSGKSGLLIGMLEELINKDIPSIIIDIKGDLVNIAKQTDESLRAKMEVRMITPGAFHGETVNIFSSLNKLDKVNTTVSALLKMIGEKHDPIQSRAHIFLSNLIRARIKLGHSNKLRELIHSIQDPPFNMLGAMELDEVYPRATRFALAGKVNNLLTAPSFASWRTGLNFNMDELLSSTQPGKTPVLVYSVAHLVDDEEKMFAVSIFLNEIVSWMRGKDGSNELKYAMFIDECFGLMPPAPYNPITKKPILTMLKQARAYGLGLLLATQNPMDLDYKGMANCQTWLIGRLQTKNDRRRVIEGVCKSGYHSKAHLENQIGSLQPREFLLVRPTGTAVFNTRTVSAELSGPLSVSEIEELYQNNLLVRKTNV